MMQWPVHMKVVHREKERANAQDFYASEVDFVVLFVATVFSLLKHFRDGLYDEIRRLRT